MIFSDLLKENVSFNGATRSILGQFARVKESEAGVGVCARNRWGVGAVAGRFFYFFRPSSVVEMS